MNSPSLNNFTTAPEHPSFWKRFGWIVVLVVIGLLAGGWYAASIFIQPSTEMLEPSVSGIQPPKIPANAPEPKPNGKIYDYTQAKNHVGENAGVRGVVKKVFVSANVTFLDFCSTSKNCPFSGVIFKEDISKFPNITKYQGKTVILNGIIKMYNGEAEMILSDPRQIWQEN